jgi:hydrophobic/amphiphilic exporter-1 (mainly G- bacteria), HAE1 family
VSISEPFIRRPIGTALLAVGLMMTGVVTFPMLPIAPLPQVDFPTIQVSTALPGASAETMAASVTTPLERQFSVIAGVTELTSTSSLGSSSITVQFDLDRNIDSAAGDVLSAINAAGGQLPTNLPSPPSYKKVNPADSPILLLSLTSASLPLTVVDDAADTVLAQQLSQITGVAQVSINGQQKPAVRIQLDPAKIASLGLGLEDVRAQIVNASVEAPIGTFDGPQQSFAIYDNDQILAAAPWNDVIVAYRNGGPVRIRDIGRAVDGPENTKLAAWANGVRCILLAVYKQPGANVIDTVDQVKAALPRLRATIPAAIDVAILADRTQTIRASVSDVELTLVITIVLVVAIIFLFLRSAWATIIPGVTVPLSLAGTFAAMYLLGYSLDNLSLMGLSIAVGFVVDDAIVMLENVVRHIEEGLKPLDAALKGAGEIGFTIVSISLSLVAVFIPLLLMGGIVGRLFREFAITVTVAILISGILALSLTPMMCARFLRSEKEARHGRLYLVFERGFDRLLAGYERGLKGVLKHQLLTLCVFLATLAFTVFLFVFIPKSFFPEQDTGSISGSAEGAQDISSAAMWNRLGAMDTIIRQDPDVATIGYTAGSSAFNTGTFFITLKAKGERSATADQIIARLRPKLAAIEGANLYLQVLQDIKVGGRLGRTQYQYTLQDGNLDELDIWAPKLLTKLQGLPLLADVTSDQQANAATATLTIDRDRASRFGIQPSLINATIYDAIGQREVAQYFTQLNSYHVVLEVDPALQADPRLLDKLYLTSPITAQQVPVSTFERLDMTKTAYLAINHQSQFPAVTISFNMAGGAALGDAVTAIQQLELEQGSPPTLTGSFQGTAQAFQTSLASQPYLIAAALLVVYLILGVLYESFIHPLTILSTLPSAGVGALLMLMLFGYDLSVIALIGIIMLIGIVKKNGIMIVDFALTAQREQNISPDEAIYRACLLRFRPIMMTTMCAMFGGVPLMIGGGTGSELRQPLGFAIVGGLLVSQALTLFTTPVVYLYLDRASHWRRRRPTSTGLTISGQRN